MLCRMYWRLLLNWTKNSSIVLLQMWILKMVYIVAWKEAQNDRQPVFSCGASLALSVSTSIPPSFPGSCSPSTASWRGTHAPQVVSQTHESTIPRSSSEG
mmetsp:Transcript_9895/g.36888  ORF Transcript_9895/g.36888 Transcript_9895/m.36888 type:complete len:100 (-) Transcript_9895:1432-1731(-)